LVKAKPFVHSVLIVHCKVQKIDLYEVPHVLSVRDRFQVDLVDMSANRNEIYFGHERSLLWFRNGGMHSKNA
jgi:hypothetical protein